VFIAALMFAGLLYAPRAQAQTTFSSDIQMTNAQLAPASGTLDWSSPWQLEAAASIFDSQNGFTNSYQFQMGQPATVSASAATPLVAAASQAGVDAAGNILSLQASLSGNIPLGATFTAFASATAYREFEITEGSGPVPVTFSFDYAGDGSGYLASLRISDGVNQWDLTASDAPGTPDPPFGGTLSDTFDLDYDTPYSISLTVDDEPEPSSLHLLGLGIILYGGWRVLKARGREGSRCT